MTRGARVWSPGHLTILVALVGAAFLLYAVLHRGDRDALVVYCAHDSIYSEGILKEFERQTGIRVIPRFDTEATKSLGLVELLIREQAAPRCDVFWNNEMLGTLDLQEKGILLPYKGSAYRRIPAACKDPEGHWVGFGARLRVYIVNTGTLAPTSEAVDNTLRGDLSRVAVAKPLYGTTLTQYSVLWQLWGGEKLGKWHREWRERGVREVNGNAMVKDLVARGVCNLGLTDTDDFFEAKDAQMPVAMLPMTLETGQVVCIPNTASIVKSTRHLEEARKLVDFLGSEECELALANSKSRQIPLGTVNEDRLSNEVKQLRQYVKAAYPLSGLAAARDACLAWLKAESLK